MYIRWVIEREQPTVADEKNVYVLLTDDATYRRYRALSVPAQALSSEYIGGLNAVNMWNDGTPVPDSELIGTDAWVRLQPEVFRFQTSKPVIDKEMKAEWQQNPVRNWLSQTL